MTADAQHIAIATLAEVDVLVSWNFKHIVNLSRIKGYNAVNLGMGYRPLEIRTPRCSMAKIEKHFDCVRMMREIRDRLDREMEHMTSEERIAYINGRADRAASELGLPPAVDARVAAERARAAREAAGGEHARLKTA